LDLHTRMCFSKRRVGRGTKPTIHKNVGCISYPPYVLKLNN